MGMHSYVIVIIVSMIRHAKWRDTINVSEPQVLLVALFF